MPRVVSLFLPAWSTDRVRRELGGAAPPAEAPLVLTACESIVAEERGRPFHKFRLERSIIPERRTFDCATFNLAIDSKLRGCDVIALKVEDVVPAIDSGGINRDAINFTRALGRGLLHRRTGQDPGLPQRLTCGFRRVVQRARTWRLADRGRCVCH
jgi:hypothetical protein